MTHGPLPNGAATGEPEIQPGRSGADYIAVVDREITPPFKSKLGGKPLHEFMTTRPVRDWIVKGVFLARTLFLGVGEPGCGKSFLFLDLCMTMALACVDPRAPREWFGRKIKACGIVYVAAEGQEDFVIRAHAGLRARGLASDTELPFYLLPTVVDMRSSDAQTKDLIADIKGFEAHCVSRFGVSIGLVMFDTLNRSLAGGTDSNPEHVGAFVRNCSTVRETLGLACGAVHHTPRGGDRARGHSSVTADNDAEIFIKPSFEGAPNAWIVTRTKASAKGDRHEFRLRQIELARDVDGEAVTSCYVAAGAHEGSLEGVEMRDAAEAERTKKPYMTADGRSILGPNLTVVMRALHDAIDRIGEDPLPTLRAVPHGRRVIKFSTWTDEIVRAMPGDDKDGAKFKDKCRKARDSGALALRNRGIIGMDQDYVWRTSKRVAMIDRALGSEPEPIDSTEEVGDGQIPF